MQTVSIDEVVQVMSTLNGNSITIVYQNLNCKNLVSEWRTDASNVDAILRLASLGLVLEIRKHKKKLKNKNPQFIFYFQ